jgi:hypothetical protein
MIPLKRSGCSARLFSLLPFWTRIQSIRIYHISERSFGTSSKSSYYLSILIMYILSLVSILAVPALVFSLPGQHPGSKRACTNQWPDVVETFSQAAPTTSETGTLRLARSDGPGSNTLKAGITFHNIPAGATGCMLNLAIPPVSSPNQFAIGSNTFDVRGVSSPIESTTNWNTIPPTTTLWATMNMPEGIQTSPFQTVLVSTRCSSTMSFLLQLSDWQQGAGQVWISQEPTQYGFWLTYNC